MDLADPRAFELFLEIYGSLPRAGPGSTADTLRALSLVPVTEPASVLDLGCGPGAQTLVLAEALPGASILAVDLAPQMVTEARRRVDEAGVGGRVRVEGGDLSSPPVPVFSQDLIWCEGAIYFVGVEAALRAWRPLLTDGGCVAFTELIWTDPSPPAELVSWWLAEHPDITDEEGVRTAVRAAGFDTVGAFVLPDRSSWNEYYGPMEVRIPEFVAAHQEDPTALGIADEATMEIDMFRRYSDCYSYGFFVVRPGVR